jgi:hypothetical protein
MARNDTKSNSASPLSGFQPASGLLMAICILTGIGIMALVSQFNDGRDSPANATDPLLTKAVERMADRFERLSDQQGEIARRMMDLELAMIGSSSPNEVMPIGDDNAPIDLEEIRDLMAQLADAPQSGSAFAKGPVVDQMIEAMQYIDQQEQSDRETRREERRQESLAQNILDLTELLALDANQQLAIQNLLTDAISKRDALEDEMLPRNERRDAHDALREETEAMVSNFLSPSQIQLLEENGGLDSGRNSGGGGGGGGGRGRGR